MIKIDINNKQFGDLYVIKDLCTKNLVECKCNCGKIIQTRKGRLISGEKISCGCKTKTKSLIGQKFGKLTIIKQEVNIKHRTAWLCKCKCGKCKIVRTDYLKNGWVKSCGCLQKFEEGVAASRVIYGHYKRNAKYRNMTFELNFEEFKNLIFQNCFYCGEIPTNKTNYASTNGQCNYNGIDRKDNNIGYSKDNCVPCCKTCNLAKRTASVKEFQTWITKVYNNLRKK